MTEEVIREEEIVIDEKKRIYLAYVKEKEYFVIFAIEWETNNYSGNHNSESGSMKFLNIFSSQQEADSFFEKTLNSWK